MELMIYKFKDRTDRKFAFVLATNVTQATKNLESKTTLKFDIIGMKKFKDVYKSFIIKNQILPF